MRELSENGYRTDLIGLNGESFFSKIKSVGDADETAIAVWKEDSYGLIDRNGEWIIRIRQSEEEDD